MQIRYSKNYIKGIKELKKKHKVEEMETLTEIIELIINSDSYKLLKESPLAYFYGFEELKANLSGFCSFRLSKKKSQLRLIGRYVNEIMTLELVYISMNHYEDFDPKGVIINDE